MSARRAILLLATAFLIGDAWLETPAQAAFPGANGKIAFEANATNQGVYVINPDGTGETALLPGGPPTYYYGAPAWAPSGSQLAFYYSEEEFTTIQKANADGTNQTYVTIEDVYGDPAWSPDGTKLVFSTFFAGALFTVNADGTGRAQLSSGPEDHLPAWSPNGDKIAFQGDSCCIYAMNSNGTGRTLLAQGSNPDWSPDGTKLVFSGCAPGGTPCGLIVMNADGSQARAIDSTGGDPAWSPDGHKIVASLGCCSLYVMDADGSNKVLLTSTSGTDPDWQPLPTRSYAHPQSASPLQVALVRAFRQCGISSNPIDGRHSPPLGTQACLPPAVGSNVARLGPDAQGSASFTAVPGDTDPTNGDQADLTLSALLSDIEDSTGADYLPNPSGPDMTEITRLRLTDKANNYGGASGTTTESDFRVPIECQATADPALGSSCAANTSADALQPGFITEQRQTVIQAFRVRVDDAGANGVPGNFDDRIFATQGFYVP